MPNFTQLNSYSKLSFAMKKDIAEMKANRNGNYNAELSLSILILIFEIPVDSISKWLAAPLPSLNHNTAIKKKQPRTGEWFTQSEEFTKWKTGTSSFIWLHGIRRS